jgi:hypothetical protein
MRGLPKVWLGRIPVTQAYPLPTRAGPVTVERVACRTTDRAVPVPQRV